MPGVGRACEAGCAARGGRCWRIERIVRFLLQYFGQFWVTVSSLLLNPLGDGTCGCDLEGLAGASSEARGAIDGG